MPGFKRKVMRGPKGQPKKWAGTWEFSLYRGHDPVPDENGKHRKVYASTVWPPEDERDPKNPPGARAADRALNAWVAKIEDKGDRPGSTASLDYTVLTYLALLEDLKRSPTTLQGYHNIYKVWIKGLRGKDEQAVDPIGTVPIGDLTAGRIRQLYADMTKAGLSRSRIRQAHAVIQGALKMAAEKEWIPRNVATLLTRPPQDQSDPYCPSPEEVDRIFREAGGDESNLGACVGMGATLGRRLGELCAVRESDINFKAGTIALEESSYTVTGKPADIKDTKTHTKVTIPTGKLALERLRARLRCLKKRAREVGVELIEDPYLLSVKANGDGPPRPDYYTKRMGKLRDKLEMPDMHLHSLRHFHATYLIDAGFDLLTIARRLGWADASMLAKVYGHHKRDDADRAVAEAVGGFVKFTSVPQLGPGGGNKPRGRRLVDNMKGRGKSAMETDELLGLLREE